MLQLEFAEPIHVLVLAPKRLVHRRVVNAVDFEYELWLVAYKPKFSLIRFERYLNE